MKKDGKKRPEETFFREQLQGNLPSSFLEESSEQVQEQGKIFLTFLQLLGFFLALMGSFTPCGLVEYTGVRQRTWKEPATT